MATKQNWRTKKKHKEKIKLWGMRLVIFGCGVIFATVFQRIALLLVLTGLVMYFWYERKYFL